MKFFDKCKKRNNGAKQPETVSQPTRSPVPNTAVIVFFDRPNMENEDLKKNLLEKFGAESILSIDDSQPSVTHFMLRIDNKEMICSYMPFPYPKEECDILDLFHFNHYITEEEQKALVQHRSFCILTEIGGGKTLAGKRSVCLLLTKLCGSLLQIEGAAGVYYSAANLLLGRQMYLRYAAISEQEETDPEYFPSMLWILVYQTVADDGAPAVETCGLAEFGFLELQFYHPKEDWAYSYEKLYLMSVFQITGKDVYRNRDTISFTQDSVSVFKQCGEKLSVIGGI